MLDAFHIVVPVAIHQISNPATSGFGQVVGILLDNLMERHRLDDDDLLTIGRELETFHLSIRLTQLFAVRTIGLHHPNLTTTKVCNSFSIQPCRIGFALAAGCQLTIVASVCIHDADNLMALVLLDTVVAYLIDYLLTIGRSLYSSDASHSPQGFRSHHATFQFDITLSDVHVVFCIYAAQYRQYSDSQDN